MTVEERSEGNLRQVARDVTRQVLGDGPFKVGDVVSHPSGRTVKIIGGAWMSNGRLSNHWRWQEVLPDGNLSETVEHGYGWDPA